MLFYVAVFLHTTIFTSVLLSRIVSPDFTLVFHLRIFFPYHTLKSTSYRAVLSYSHILFPHLTFSSNFRISFSVLHFGISLTYALPFWIPSFFLDLLFRITLSYTTVVSSFHISLLHSYAVFHCLISFQFPIFRWRCITDACIPPIYPLLLDTQVFHSRIPQSYSTFASHCQSLLAYPTHVSHNRIALLHSRAEHLSRIPVPHTSFVVATPLSYIHNTVPYSLPYFFSSSFRYFTTVSHYYIPHQYFSNLRTSVSSLRFPLSYPIVVSQFRISRSCSSPVSYVCIALPYAALIF